MENTWAYGRRMLYVTSHVLIGHVEAAVVMVPENRITLMVQAPRIRPYRSAPQDGHRHAKMVSGPLPACGQIGILGGRTVGIDVELQRLATGAPGRHVVHIVCVHTSGAHLRQILDNHRLVDNRKL